MQLFLAFFISSMMQNVYLFAKPKTKMDRERERVEYLLLAVLHFEPVDLDWVYLSHVSEQFQL